MFGSDSHLEFSGQTNHATFGLWITCFKVTFSLACHTHIAAKISYPETAYRLTWFGHAFYTERHIVLQWAVFGPCYSLTIFSSASWSVRIRTPCWKCLFSEGLGFVTFSTRLLLLITTSNLSLPVCGCVLYCFDFMFNPVCSSGLLTAINF